MKEASLRATLRAAAGLKEELAQSEFALMVSLNADHIVAIQALIQLCCAAASTAKDEKVSNVVKFMEPMNVILKYVNARQPKKLANAFDAELRVLLAPTSKKRSEPLHSSVSNFLFGIVQIPALL